MTVDMHLGDVMAILPTLRERSVHCVVTSPPYFALRSYLPRGHADKGKEIGSEVSPEAFIATMVAVFREVRRVLRDDGCCWVNLGDSYGTQGGGGEQRMIELHGRGSGGLPVHAGDERPSGTKAKESNGQLLNIPHRVAEALRQDGWIWRQTVVWQKRSPMPESVGGWRWQRCRVKVASQQRDLSTKVGGNAREMRISPPHPDNGIKTIGAEYADCPGCPKCAPNGGYVLRRGSGRCTTAHEYLFLLTKTGKYFWDGEASKEAVSGGMHKRAQGKSSPKELAGVTHDRWGDYMTNDAACQAAGRNPRSVWTISSEPSSEKHFASFPSELVRRCLASSPATGGVCAECGAPWAPVVSATRTFESGSGKSGILPSGKNGDGMQGGGETGDIRRGPVVHSTVHGYKPTCTCCSLCDIMGIPEKERANYHVAETNTSGPGVHQGMEAEEVCGEQRVQGQVCREATTIQGPVQEMREALYGKGENVGILQQDMLCEVDVGTGATKRNSGNSVREVQARERRREEHDGASSCCGKDIGEKTGDNGSCASQEREQGGQQAGKPGDSKPDRTREAAQQARHHELTPYPKTGPTILDIFGGTGTVQQTARHLGCKSIYIDLNPDYYAIAERNIPRPPRWWLRQQAKAGKPVKVEREPMTLFGRET